MAKKSKNTDIAFGENIETASAEIKPGKKTRKPRAIKAKKRESKSAIQSAYDLGYKVAKLEAQKELL